MDDSFQFIIESPQNNTGHKKRPRLVTSCDNCRLKKIKCLQSSPESKCEACKAAKIPCKFKDRERYFAERSRAIAGPNAPISYDTQSHNGYNNNAPSLDAFSLSSSSQPRLSSPSSSQDPRRMVDAHYRHSSNSSMGSFDASGTGGGGGMPAYDYPNHSSSVALHPSSGGGQLRSPVHHHHQQQQQPRLLPLFDPQQPQYPNSSLMPHFIQLFFEQLGSEFPFISYDSTIHDYYEQRLPPMLANSIAAMSSRFTNVPDVINRGLHNVVDAFADNAKALFSPIAHIPSLSTLYALIILSWSEYKSNRLPNFRSYCQLALRMANDLQLSDETTAQLNIVEAEKNRRRATWASVVQLHLTASSFR